MLLAFDIGNTNIVIGLFQEDTLASHWRITSDRQKTYRLKTHTPTRITLKTLHFARYIERSLQINLTYLKWKAIN
ncbi:MAG: type III pantothenate kinase, partial [Peptococcaceae bacterium]|nr:type III pantothenate kinase [Peptococcaceae bacterium]